MLADSGVELVDGPARLLDGASSVAVGEQPVARPARADRHRRRAARATRCPASTPAMTSERGARPARAARARCWWSAAATSPSSSPASWRGLGAQVDAGLPRPRCRCAASTTTLRTGAAAALRGRGITLRRAASRSRRCERDARRLRAAARRRLACCAPTAALNATGRHPEHAGLGLPRLASRSMRGRGRRSTPTAADRAARRLGDRRRDATGVNLTPVAIAEGRALRRLASSAGGPRDVDHRTRGQRRVHRSRRSPPIGLTEAEAARRGAGWTIFETDFRPMKTAFAGGSRAHAT
ncbi:MAG: hypothetical protein MZW92_55950 [Comamonadaceae bacterium]|nr:hypothetical protein [Comamonadaceae bacterium]